MPISAPPAGMAPMGKPMAVPRSQGFQERAQSALVIQIEPFTASTLSSPATGVAATGGTAPTMATRMFGAAPHAALNFGHRDGWSYLSIGAGTAKVRATQDGVEDQPASWGLAFHYGGGARWFVRERLEDRADARTAAAWRAGHRTAPTQRTPARVA